MTVIVKARFLRNGIPSGAPYSYITPDDGETYKVGDLVYLSIGSIGQIVETDVPEDRAGYPADKLRSFIRRADEPEIRTPDERSENTCNKEP